MKWRPFYFLWKMCTLRYWTCQYPNSQIIPTNHGGGERQRRCGKSIGALNDESAALRTLSAVVQVSLPKFPESGPTRLFSSDRDGNLKSNREAIAFARRFNNMDTQSTFPPSLVTRYSCNCHRAKGKQLINFERGFCYGFIVASPYL